MSEQAVLYAIGDVHGRDDLLERLHDLIRADAQRSYPARARRIVQLGDYVDRGPASSSVIERLMAGVPGFTLICLKGNHEDMMLSYLETGERRAAEQWLVNGGRETLESYGMGPADDPFDVRAVREAVGERHWNWLRGLRLSHSEAGNFFVHAGILPGCPLDRQQAKDLLWIRHVFLESRADHGLRIVHGHTPVPAPEVRPNRINLDTGAWISGHLSCAVFDGTENGAAPRFLMT